MNRKGSSKDRGTRAKSVAWMLVAVWALPWAGTVLAAGAKQPAQRQPDRRRGDVLMKGIRQEPSESCCEANRRAIVAMAGAVLAPRMPTRDRRRGAYAPTSSGSTGAPPLPGLGKRPCMPIAADSVLRLGGEERIGRSGQCDRFAQVLSPRSNCSCQPRPRRTAIPQASGDVDGCASRAPAPVRRKTCVLSPDEFHCARAISVINACGQQAGVVGAGNPRVRSARCRGTLRSVRQVVQRRPRCHLHAGHRIRLRQAAARQYRVAIVDGGVVSRERQRPRARTRG